MEHIPILVISRALSIPQFKINVLRHHKWITTSLWCLDQVVLKWLFHLIECTLLLVLKDIWLRIEFLQILQGRSDISLNYLVLFIAVGVGCFEGANLLQVLEWFGWSTGQLHICVGKLDLVFGLDRIVGPRHKHIFILFSLLANSTCQSKEILLVLNLRVLFDLK